MGQAVLLARTLKRHELVTDEGRAVLDVWQERGHQLVAILGHAEQTFGGQPLCPRVLQRRINFNRSRV